MAAIICFTGHVVADGELVTTASGAPMLKFKVAANTGYGQNKKVTFWRVALFGKQGESVAPYIAKGKLVFVSGEASAELNEHNGKSYLNADVKANEVQLLGKREESSSRSANSGTSVNDDDDDRVPF